MNKNKYKDQNKENYKKNIIVLFVMIFILMFVSMILGSIYERNQENIEDLENKKLSSIQEVIEYHKSTYITEYESTEKDIKIDAEVVFIKSLYENNISNEQYFTDVINDCAKAIYYKSFRLIDKKNDIVIKVICKNGKIDSIFINDIEDYFIYMDSQIGINSFKEIKTTPLNIESEILKECVEKNWKKEISFGERDSIFDNYYIFFDEGIKVRIIDEKVYNIVFTKQYKNAVVNNCFPGVDLKYVEAEIGTPTFKDEEAKIIGYKGEQIYVFFTDSEISVYRNSTIDSDDFFKLADKFVENEIDLLEFMNELTYLWPDYTTYEYDETSIYINYPLKGIEIAINNGDINGILVYNNNKSTLSKIGKYLEDTRFVSRLQTDLVFKTEKQRLEKSLSWINLAKEHEKSLSKEELDFRGRSLKYCIYPEIDSNGNIYKIRFISEFGNEPDRELNDGVSTYLWESNDYFIYSKKGSGIYFYNLNTGRIQRIVTGKITDEFNITSYENGVLEYDDKKCQLQF